MNLIKYQFAIVLFLFYAAVFQQLGAQSVQTVEVHLDDEHQTITGFGASLAFYEGWLPAHPNRTEIYDVIFKELSLDILRVRNAYGYDNNMIGYVKQFASAAQNSLGHPIDIMVTSWGPPGYLKSNNDKSNGGTLRYTVNNGKVEFDYAGFAQWWNASLDNYNTNGIYPKYISIQNEPDWEAFYESCLMRPSEVVTANDTIAGYNKALDAVYDTVKLRENPPFFLGPECIGIGYNAVENYINPLDISKLHGIAYHLYHGAESGTVEDDPFTSTNYKKVRNFHPEVPHFQTEYSREDWFTVAGMMFQSLTQGNVTAWLYWDLAWENGGLVNLHFPWDRNRWTNSVGYNRTKDFFVFKHYSAFIHPGWKRTSAQNDSELLKTASFISSSCDSATFIAINRSETESFQVRIQIPGYTIREATAYTTTESTDFAVSNYMTDTLLLVPPKSISTVDLRISYKGPKDLQAHACDFADQSALNAAITDWIDAQTEALEAGVAGECDDPQAMHNFEGQYISLSEGGSITIEWTINELCEPLDNLNATFSVSAPEEITGKAPENRKITTCVYANQTELNAAIFAWVTDETAALQASISGGCEPKASHNYAGDSFPVCEGGSLTVKWFITDRNDTIDHFAASFTMKAPEKMTYLPPGDMEENACSFSNYLLLRETIAAWVTNETAALEASITGGCKPQVSHNYTDQSIDLSEGGSLTIQWTIIDVCENIPLTATFELKPDTLNRLEGLNPFAGKGILEASVFPNPFSHAAHLQFVSAEDAYFTLEVFDLTGKKTEHLNLGFYPAGKHQKMLFRNGLEAGIYFFRLQNSEGESARGKFVIAD
jgi:glucuronoarabinoxylan endo-1,4-beta-xylanase